MFQRFSLVRCCTSVLSAGLFLRTACVEGCCMAPVTYEGSVGQDSQEAILIHRDGVEDLILRIAYRFTPDESGALPEKLTWLIALPAEPSAEDGYALANEAIFEEVFWASRDLLSEQAPVPRDTFSGAAPASESESDSVELGQAVSVGPYDIQPVRGVGQHALEGLNNYLEARGFPTEGAEHMAWFVEHGFTFLCIEVTPKKARRPCPLAKSCRRFVCALKPIGRTTRCDTPASKATSPYGCTR